MFRDYEDTAIQRYRMDTALKDVKIAARRLLVTLKEVLRYWPGLWVILIGLLPRRVWYVEGPPGSGPSGASPQEAADFVACDTEDNTLDGGEPVKFAPEELSRLWYPGARVERGGWSIKCILVSRWKWGLYEWGGW